MWIVSFLRRWLVSSSCIFIGRKWHNQSHWLCSESILAITVLIMSAEQRNKFVIYCLFLIFSGSFLWPNPHPTFGYHHIYFQSDGCDVFFMSWNLTLVLLNWVYPALANSVDQISWPLQKPTDLDLHWLPFSIWICVDNLDQAIWWAEN